MRRATERFKVLFGGEHSLYIVYEAKDGDVFSDRPLRAVGGITRELERYRLDLAPGTVSPLEHIVDVATIVNAGVLEPRGDGLISRQFLGSRLPATEAERERYRRRALAHPRLRKQFISGDSRFGEILIRTDFGTTLVSAGGAADGDSGKPGGFADTGAAPDLSNLQDVDAAPDSGERAEFVVEDPLEYTAFMHAVDAILEQPRYTAPP